MKEYKEIDLTPLMKITKRLVADVPHELKIIEYYSYYPTDDGETLEKFTNYLLNQLYYEENKIYPFSEIEAFFGISRYLNVVLKFMNYLDIAISRITGPGFENVKFNKFISKTESSLIVEFEVTS